MSPFTRDKRTSVPGVPEDTKKTNVHSSAKMTVLKSFIVTVALSNTSFGEGLRESTQNELGKKKQSWG